MNVRVKFVARAMVLAAELGISPPASVILSWYIVVCDCGFCDVQFLEGPCCEVVSSQLWQSALCFQEARTF